jgi:Glycosyltransferase family 87
MPRLTRAGAALTRFRVALLVTVYVTVAVTTQCLFGPGGDSAVFGQAGRTLLSRHWADTFADPNIQSGPLFLVLHGVGSVLTHGLPLPPYVGGGLCTALANALLTVAACRAVMGHYRLTRRDTAVRELGLGLVFALTGGLWLVSIYAHPDDVMVTLMLVLAASRAAEGRYVLAGGFFGIAVGVKLWALVAVAVLLVRASRSDAARSVVAAVTTIAVVYGPFFVLGHVNTFDWVWQVEDPAPINLFLATGTNFTWSLRLLQAGVAAAAGLVALRSAKGGPSAIWLVPAAAIAGRLLLDPRGLVYYYPPLLLCLLLGQWASSSLSTLGTTLTSLVWVVPVIATFVIATHTAGSLWVATFCIGVLVLAVRGQGHRGVRGNDVVIGDQPLLATPVHETLAQTSGPTARPDTFDVPPDDDCRDSTARPTSERGL